MSLWYTDRTAVHLLYVNPAVHPPYNVPVQPERTPTDLLYVPVQPTLYTCCTSIRTLVNPCKTFNNRQSVHKPWEIPTSTDSRAPVE